MKKAVTNCLRCGAPINPPKSGHYNCEFCGAPYFAGGIFERSVHYVKSVTETKGFNSSIVIPAGLGSILLAMLIFRYPSFQKNQDQNIPVNFNKCSNKENSTQKVFKRTIDGVVGVTTDSGIGSGFIIRHTNNKTYILTNSHVIKGFIKVKVTLKNGYTNSAIVISDAGDDYPINDLAILEVNGKIGKALNLNHKPPSIGSNVIAIGSPEGLDFTLTRGIVSSLREQGNIIQSDVALNPGNSGGPLIDEYGCVTGINTMGLIESEGLNFAISAKRIKSYIDTQNYLDLPQNRTPKRSQITTNQRFIGNLSNTKSAAYKRAKKIMNPDLYLTYRLTERILEANDIKRPIRIAVRKGADCIGTLGLDPNSSKCSSAQLLPDIDKITNFDIWASQVINTMAGQANAFANSDSGFLFVNKALLKELKGRPEQLACVISHELAHITQNHTEAKRKARFKYDSIAASRISERIDKLRKRQQGNNFMAAFIAGISDSYSGTNTSVNQLSNRIALNNLASQMLAPQIIEKAMKYSPVISKSITKMQGLSPEYVNKGFSYLDSYLRDSTLSLTAFSRGLEYEADLLGTQYAATAGFDEKKCLKLWTETMPHDTDKLVARLLPPGISDPGKKQPEIFNNKKKTQEVEYDPDCKIRYKVRADRLLERKCKLIAKGEIKTSDKISEETLEILSTHPSDERRANAIREHIENKDLFNIFRAAGKQNRSKNTMRDWSYDKDSDTLVISDIEKDPKLIGLGKTGTTGINIDKFLD